MVNYPWENLVCEKYISKVWMKLRNAESKNYFEFIQEPKIENKHVLDFF
jgi:hypothetical protein